MSARKINIGVQIARGFYRLHFKKTGERQLTVIAFDDHAKEAVPFELELTDIARLRRWLDTAFGFVLSE